MAKILSIFLVSVLILVGCVRFYQLGQTPPGINVDEASYGYDAYSLLKTGRDVWGERGMTLRSFGDFKPAGLALTLAPLVKTFGLSTLTTRLPSASFGLLTLIMTFFLLKLLLKSTNLALVGSIILGLSPWHFGLSRLFYESNVGLFYIVGAIYAELGLIRAPQKIRYAIVAAGLSALAGYYYSVLRYTGMALLGISVLLAYFPRYVKIIQSGLICFVVWAIVALPYVGDMLSAKALVRLQQEGSLQEFGNTLVINENRQMCYLSSEKNPIFTKVCYLLWNKPGEKLINTGKVYVQLLSPKYLFLNGYQKDVIPESYGAFLELLFPLYVLGIYDLLAHVSRQQRGYLYILLGWLITPIPIALAGALSIHRNVVGLYFVFLISCLGLSALTKALWQIRSQTLKYGLVVVALFAFFWSQARFMANYFYVYTHMQPEIWLYDTPDLMHYVSLNNHGRKINYVGYDFGSLYYAFYAPLDPALFQKEARWSQPNVYGWMHPEAVGTRMQNLDNIWIPICTQSQLDAPAQLIIVPGNKAEWESVVEAQFKNFTGIHILHEVYDSRVVYQYLKTAYPKVLNSECQKLQ